MPFNLPSSQYLMTGQASVNRGSFDNPFQLGRKTGGNLPITTNGTQVQNSGGSEGILFGLDSQNSTTAKDASTETKVLLTSVQFNAPNRIQVDTIGNRGIVARFVSGSGGANYREYRIGGNDTPFASSQVGPVTICLDLSAVGHDDSGGTYDNSDVTGWGYGTTYLPLASTNSNLNFFQRVFLFDSEKGGSNLPYFEGSSNFDDAVTVVQGTDYTTKIGAWLTKSGSSFFIPAPFSFGDGSSPINFNDGGVSVVSPSNNSAGQENFRLTNAAMRVYLDTRNNAADSVVLSGSYVWGTAAPWDFSQSNAGTCELSGNFNGMGEFSLGSSVTASGAFDLASGSAVVSEGANINGITVRKNLNIVGSSVTSFEDLTVDGVLDFDTAGTYTLTNCSIEEVTNSSGGAVIINNADSTINTNTGPDISIVTPPSTLTLTGLQADSEVRVYDAGTTTELAGVENSGTSFTADISAASVDIVVHSIGYEYQKIEGADTSSNLTLPIQQRVDRNYRNP